MLRFVPAADILQSNHIAVQSDCRTRNYNTLTSGKNSRHHYSRGFVKRGVVASIQKVFEKQSELGRGYNDPKPEFNNLLGIT